jgi:uncharacterized membrane protein
MVSSKNLRMLGLESLKGKWLLAIIITIFALFVLPNILHLINPGIKDWSIYFYIDKAWVILTTGAFWLGRDMFFLYLVRKNETNFSQLFSYFRSIKLFLNSFAYYVFITIYLILWGLLLVIPGIIKSYSYSLTPFLLIDNPELSVNQAITKSRKLMNGKKLNLFLLDLSFIGWLILSVLTFGVGFIWLAPYYRSTVAQFYQQVLSMEKNNE